MTDVALLIQELRKEIEEDRAALAVKESALAFLEKRSGKAEIVTAAPARDFDPTALNIETRTTLVSAVKDILPKIGESEFTVAHIESALRQVGAHPGGQTPRARIAVVLGKLEKAGLIIKTHAGAGNIPNQYKVATVADIL